MAKKCSSVIACRVSPKQKREIIDIFIDLVRNLNHVFI